MGGLTASCSQFSEVVCRYFVYGQRPEDQVLAALVRKTETIREQLGSAGQVIADRIHQRLTRNGIARPAAAALAHDIEAEEEGRAHPPSAARDGRRGGTPACPIEARA